MRFTILMTICLLAANVASGAQPTEADLKADWKNDQKSVLSLTKVDLATGEISGQFKTDPSQPTIWSGPVVGWVSHSAPPQPTPPSFHNAMVISISVRWQNSNGDSIGRITSWTGYLYQDASGKWKIVGQWLLTRSNADFDWSHIFAGQDTFVRQ
jgi:hypothetical protein